MTDTAVVSVDEERERRRKLALLRAVGLDRVPDEQRTIALEIASKYELDLILKHLVLVDGRPYITRDGLLHVAHRSGQLDGIEVTEPEIVKLEGQGDFWKATASVYRKDMSRPFRYTGRYPVKGGNNARFAPEMAVKVAEVMALRRAFDVSAPVIEERWDIQDTTAPAPEPPLREQIAAKRAALDEPRPVAQEVAPLVEDEAPMAGRNTRKGAGAPAADAAPADEGEPMPAPERCDGFTKELGRCVRPSGHEGNHRNANQDSWA